MIKNNVIYSNCYSVVFVGAIAAANIIAGEFGPSVTPFTAFALIGLDLSLRDKLHDAWNGRGLWWRMGALIAAGSVVSLLAAQNTGSVAIASCVAFAASSGTDAMVYHSTRNRQFVVKSNLSNIAGAAVDSLLFPTLAFGALLPGIVAAQFAVKVAGGWLWSVALVKCGGRK